jgi:transposase
MSLPPRIEYSVPEETARVAWEIFPEGNLYMQWYDTFGTLFEDRDFAALFSAEGQPALSPMRLCLVLLLQFAEGLSDRQAAEAVRTRIDWKYLLCLELNDTGFHYSVLSEFRGRLVTHGTEAQIFNRVLELCRAKGLIKKRRMQRSDSTEVLAAIRTLNRLELVGETLRAALNVLAVTAPEWTRDHTTSEWVDRYGPRVSDYHLL